MLVLCKTFHFSVFFLSEGEKKSHQFYKISCIEAILKLLEPQYGVFKINVLKLSRDVGSHER